MTYLIYLRKSRQDNPNESVEEVLARHENILQDYAKKAIGYAIAESNIYREIVSGEFISERPEINKIIQRIQSENITGVLVVEPQRLSRGDLTDCGTISRVFRYSNTSVITPQKTYNLSDKFDRKFFESELMRGNEFLEYIKEILNRGRLQSKKEGNYVASQAPYGYKMVKINKEPTLEIEPTEAKVVKLIFEWYDSGIGYSAIASKLTKMGIAPRRSVSWCAQVIRLMLKNEVYIGKISIGKYSQIKYFADGDIKTKNVRNKEYEVVDGKHPAIIDEDLYYRCSSRIGKGISIPESNKLTNMFSGLLYCGCCGRQMAYQGKNVKGYNNYYCRTSQQKCKTKSVKDEILHKEVIELLKQEYENVCLEIESGNNEKLIQSRLVEIESIENQIEENKKSRLRLMEFLEKGVYSTEMFVQRNEMYEEKMKELTAQLEKARQELPTFEEMESKKITLHEVINTLDDDDIPASLKNQFLSEIIERIDYFKYQKGSKYDFKRDLMLKITFK